MLSQFAEGMCQAAWGGVLKRSYACYKTVSLFTRCPALLSCVRAKAANKEKFLVDEITLVFGTFLKAILVKKSVFDNTDVSGKDSLVTSYLQQCD